jgi:hypothetical protein
MSIEPRYGKNRSPMHRRFGPAALTFLVVTLGVYFSAFVAVAILRHVIMPVLAVGVGVYAASLVYRVSKRNKD